MYKYLEYKKIYLELKSKSGGAQPRRILTHPVKIILEDVKDAIDEILRGENVEQNTDFVVKNLFKFPSGLGLSSVYERGGMVDLQDGIEEIINDYNNPEWAWIFKEPHELSITDDRYLIQTNPGRGYTYIDNIGEQDRLNVVETTLHYPDNLVQLINYPDLERLIITFDYLETLDLRNLPELRNLKYLKFDYNTEHLLIPQTVEYLHLGISFNSQIVKDVLPQTLRHLTFGTGFKNGNKPLRKDILPKSLTHFNLGGLVPVVGVFNNLSNLTHLTFGDDFNEQLEPDLFKFLKNLKYLTFGRNFDKELKPSVFVHLESLTHLTFGMRFNQGFFGYERINVRTKGPPKLELRRSQIMWPRNLTHLTLGENFNQTQPGELPQTLTHLTLHGIALLQFLFPRSLRNLILINYNLPLQPRDLPETLTSLTLYRYNHPLDLGTLPPNLTDLNLYNFNHRLEQNVLPDGLRSLKLQSFNIMLTPDIFPGTLRYLYLVNYSDILEPGVFANIINLQYLELIFFNQPLEVGTLPTTLTHLFFRHFNRRLEPAVFGNLINLTHLSFGTIFTNGGDVLQRQTLPDSLEYLRVGRNTRLSGFEDSGVRVEIV